MSVKSYKDLIVWQKSIDLVIAIYKFTDLLPKTEQYGLVSQMRRSSVSIPSNIAEGSRRSSRKDFRHFLLIAFGSGSELETHLEIIRRLPFGQSSDYTIVDTSLNEVMRMLNKMISNLSTHY